MGNREETMEDDTDEDDEDDIFKQKDNILQNANLDTNLPMDEELLANIRNITALKSFSMMAEPRKLQEKYYKKNRKLLEKCYETTRKLERNYQDTNRKLEFNYLEYIA